MNIVEILVLTLSIPGMCLVLLILTCVEEWLREDTEDGWAFRPADARRPLLLPVRMPSRTPSASQAAAFSSRCISSGVASPAASASVHPFFAASGANNPPR